MAATTAEMAVHRRRGREDLELPLRDGEESDEEEAPRFPVLSKKSTIESLQTLAGSVLVGVTTINVLSSAGHDPTVVGTIHKDLRTFLVSMPYTMLPVGVLGLAFAMVATKRRHHLLGFAAGFLLFELMYIVFVGGLVTIARSDVSGMIVWPVTLVILIALVVTWSFMCTYPRFLQFCRCCTDYTVPSPPKKRCEVCRNWTSDKKSLVLATADDEKCLLCGGAMDLESQAPLNLQGMTR